MSEQLYKLEKRGGEDGELVAGKIHLIGGVHVLYGTGHVLVPVPEVHDLAWACGEMVRNPGVSYESGDEEDPVWFDEAKGNFWYQHRGNTEKVESWSINDLDSTSWRRVESKPAPQPGTPETTDFWWALRQMYESPMDEYEASPGPEAGAPWIRFRYNRMNGKLEERQRDDEWPAASVTDGMLSWTNWRKHVEPQPGTLEWAKQVVADGGAVWQKKQALVRVDRSNLWRMVSPNGWHPWGDRAWLMALPDGTRVRHEKCPLRVKRGDKLFATRKDGTESGLYIFIRYLPDSGWDLVREPQRYEPDAERMKALAKEYLGTDDESRIDILERQIEQHDHLIADLAARLARLERKDGES